MPSRRKSHKLRRRANRLRREAAVQAVIERKMKLMNSVCVDPVVEARDALSTKHAAKLRTVGCGCLAVVTAILAALAWFAWK